MVGNVFCNNWVAASRVGIGVSQRASQTVLLRNVLYDVANPLVDRGRATANLETTIRKDDAYTPERGLIR